MTNQNDLWMFHHMDIESKKMITRREMQGTIGQGGILAQTELQHGSRGIGKSGVTISNHTPTLSRLGLSKRESAEAQMLAAHESKRMMHSREARRDTLIRAGRDSTRDDGNPNEGGGKMIPGTPHPPLDRDSGISMYTALRYDL